MPPNIQLSWIQNFYLESKNKQLLRDKVQDCKDGGILQFIKFDFVAGGQEINNTILMEF